MSVTTIKLFSGDSYEIEGEGAINLSCGCAAITAEFPPVIIGPAGPGVPGGGR